MIPDGFGVVINQTWGFVDARHFTHFLNAMNGKARPILTHLGFILGAYDYFVFV
jgi:hypothetical protein